MRKLVILLITVVLFTQDAFAAVDTEAKRRNVAQIRLTCVGIRRLLPPADSAIDAGDRAALTRAYRGFYDTPPTPGSSGSTGAISYFFRRRR